MMAGWLKHHAKWILGSFACIVLLIVAGRAVYLNRQPDECVLCGSGDREVYHAPVIVNLSTGEVSEMRVYDPSMTGRNNEISKTQTTGTFSFIYCAGITGIRDTCWHICKVEIPADAKHMVPSHFCSECRERLSASKKRGFVLADFYNDNAFEVFEIVNGATYTIRDYEVTITKGITDEALEVCVQGKAEGLVFVD